MNKQKVGRFLALYFVIYPFLFVVSIIDFIVGLFLPYKYEDDSLPDKNATLSEPTDKDDTKSAFRSTLATDLLRVEDPNANLYDELANSYKNYIDVKTLGVREILSIDDEKQPNGKVFKKYSLGDYKWKSYQEIFDKINNVSNGLLKIGLKSEQNVVLFAETRPEWLMTAFSCFKIKVPVVTLYATLGIEALAYGINETKASFVITSSEQLPKIQKILSKIPTLCNLVVFTDKFTENNLIEFKKAVASNLNLNVYSIDQVEEIGANTPTITDYTKPKKDDLAVIMYTSGSTGNPKGVMISHGNLLTSTRAIYKRLGNLTGRNDRFIAYLPLAHVLELACEMVCLINGITLGYSTPQTMADTSTAIKKGQKGDLRVLKPTLMASVPIILERLSKTVYEKLSGAGWFKQTLFKRAYIQKLRRFRRGASTRLLDRILFKRISSAVLGGKCRLILSGSALLSKEVHEFTQVCLCPTIQAYGLTETCAAATTQLPNQTDNEQVGSVVSCCELRLVDWPEAGYRTTDKPNPRGEILIGGDNITMGYYQMPEKTKEDYLYINGIRYFATGDIGEMLPSGNLKIIDRKKDLVKLSGGEYVSLNKIESLIKLLPIVDNVCVVANSFKSYCVALVCPNLKKLKEAILSEKPDSTFTDEKNTEKLLSELIDVLNKDQKIHNKISKEIMDHCLTQNIDRFEIPTKYKFVKELWLPDTGLVTDSLKLKRKEMEKFYSNDIAELYK